MEISQLNLNKKLTSDGGSNRKFEVDEMLSIISTLEYNPHLGCWEEKKATIRFVTYKTEDRPKRIGDWNFNLSVYAKIPENGSTPANIKKYKMTKECVDKLSKSIDKFSLLSYTISSELVEIDGDDTFSMYHGTEWDDTITDASWMDKVNVMNDKNYYSKSLASDYK